MIVFYKKNTPTIQLLETSICTSTCSSKCIKPKSSCCNKYKKKGINCKRCPNILFQKAS